MAKSRQNWGDYLEAARRKVSIANYYLNSLEQAQPGAASPTGDAPSIPIQAHFEGAVLSVIAAVDQVAQAINSAFGLKLSASSLVNGAFASVNSTLPDVDSWFSDPIGRDLRKIRTRMSHYSYGKTLQGPCWVVESAGTDFGGSRELAAYARSAVEYGERLHTLLPLIEGEIASRLAVGASDQQPQAYG